MSVLVATAYMEEAERFDWLVAMNAAGARHRHARGAQGARPGRATLEEAFIALLPEERAARPRSLDIPPRAPARRRAGDRGARPDPDGSATSPRSTTSSFRIERGEIFGFLGSNGCGKTTTMKMLTGLLPATEGEACCSARRSMRSDMDAARRVGYMSQAFSLYTELTVRQNLDAARPALRFAGRARRGARSPSWSRGSASATSSTRCPSAAARHPPAPVARRGDASTSPRC